MFEDLSARLRESFKALAGQRQLTEANIKPALALIKAALLEADVALSVTEDFIVVVHDQALGEAVPAHLAPDQAFIKIVQDALTHMLGDARSALNLKARPPAVILMAGLTGTGKTTTVGKLCRWLMQEKKRRIMVVSTDIHRPGAMEQLEVVSREAAPGGESVKYFPATPGQSAVAIAQAALDAARLDFRDVLIVDTAGRTTVDVEMMAEIKAIHAAVVPVEVLFVVDAMTGQDAAITAKAFNAALPLTGLVLTKIDGDSRGGAALSARMITGCPIKFMGTGEHLDALEPFHPDRIASRILGMGDVMSLIESAEAKLDAKEAARLSRKLRRGQQFDLFDFREQMTQVNAMGGLEALLDKLPAGNPQMMQRAKQATEQDNIKGMLVILDSMTHQEMRRPELLNGSRKKRIALGSGKRIQDINRLMKQHKQAQKMSKKMKGGAGMKKMMAQLQGTSGAPGQGAPMMPRARRR